MTRYAQALAYLNARLVQWRKIAITLFRNQPQLSSAVVVFALGLAAILTHFPTLAGSTTLAGALFGAGAAFIGSWVTERNRATAEEATEIRRREAARLYFAPELARIVSHQVWVLDRVAANFTVASAGKHPLPDDQMVIFKPWLPILYPAATQFRDLSEADARALIEFYDSLHEITAIVDDWLKTGAIKELNTLNFLMQKAAHGLKLGDSAVERFCPNQHYDATMPASGTLRSRIERSLDIEKTALAAHLARYTKQ